MYSHFKSISVARCDIALLIPETFVIFVKRNLFLYLCASSTKIASTPKSSKFNRSSFFPAAIIFSICAFLFLSVRSKFFTVIWSAASLMPSSIIWISLYKRSLCLSCEMGIFSKLDIAIITASQSPVATFATNRFRLVFSKSFFVAIKTFAFAYSFLNSFAHCTTRWFGTTINGFCTSPISFIFIHAAAISYVFPAPTQWCNSVFLPCIILATASFWCGFNSISGFIPGKER